MRESFSPSPLTPARDLSQPGCGYQVAVEESHDGELFLPPGYEPSYPYPLIAWLGEIDESDRKLLEQLTEQNCIAVHLNRPDSAVVFPALAATRRRCHVHSERIFLAGRGTAGALSLRILLENPDQIAGAVCLDPAQTSSARLPHFGRYCDRQVFLSSRHGSAARSLHSAGLRVTISRPQSPLWSQIDAWMLTAIPTAWAR